MYNNTKSNYEMVVCGVPQGSILGPILFLIYINDLYNVSKLMKFIIFADDTNMFLSNSNLDYLESVVNNELINLVKWFRANKLSLNVDKISFMIFSSHGKECKKVIFI